MAALDRRACEQFLAAIRLYGRRRFASEADVADFTQDVMEAVLRAVAEDRVEEPQRLGAFILGVCRNIANNRHRSRQRAERIEQRLPAEGSSAHAAPRLFARWQLEDCLANLLHRSREVIRMSLHEGCSSEEVGRTLGLSSANVRVIRHRAVVQLRECLSGEEAQR